VSLTHNAIYLKCNQTYASSNSSNETEANSFENLNMANIQIYLQNSKQRTKRKLFLSIKPLLTNELNTKG
jgi:hypothetical protein